MPDLIENEKMTIFSKLEEGSIRRVAQYYNITKSTVQRIKQTDLKYQRRFMWLNLPNLYKKYDVQISKRHLSMWKNSNKATS
jgi:hypothetical protein